VQWQSSWKRNGSHLASRQTLRNYEFFMTQDIFKFSSCCRFVTNICSIIQQQLESQYRAQLRSNDLMNCECYNMHDTGDEIVPSRSSEEKCCVQDSIHKSQNPEIFISFLLFTVLKEERFDFMKKWTVRTFKNCVFPLSLSPFSRLWSRIESMYFKF
jgi:hypothetical protein